MRLRLLALLALLGAVPYLPALAYGFVFDDAWTIVHNGWLRRPLREVLRRSMAGTAALAGMPDATRPAMTVSLWLDVALHGYSSFWMHFTSICVYASLCVLAGICAFAILRSRTRAMATAVLFAVASSHAETVAVINYREDLFAAVGVFAAASVLLWPGRCARRLRWEIPAATAWFVGLCAKENAIALAGLVVLFAVSRPGAQRWLRSRERVLALLLAVLAVWGSWRWALTVGGDDIPRAAIAPPIERMIRLARFECWTLRGALVPTLAAPVSDTSRTPSAWFLAGFGAEVLATIAALRFRRTRALGVALGWIVLSALPTSPLARPANELADRYLLLPSFGGAMLWVIVLWRRVKNERVRVALVTVVALVSLVMALWNSRFYRSDEALWTRAIVASPRSPRSWSGLSYTRRHAGDLVGAIAAADTAVRLAPTESAPRVTRAYARLAMGDRAGALADLAWANLRSVGRVTRGYDRALRCARGPAEEVSVCIGQP